MTTSKEQEINMMAFLYNGCRQLLDEAQRRPMLGQMVLKADCRGAIAMLSRLTGVAFRTINRGCVEALAAAENRNRSVRVEGGGRKSVESNYPDLLERVQNILNEATYGSLETGRKWTSLSHQDIADELESRHGIPCMCEYGKALDRRVWVQQAGK